MEEVFTFISNNGFAIFVGAYMLIYQNKSMTNLTEAVNKLTYLIEHLTDKKVAVEENE